MFKFIQKIINNNNEEKYLHDLPAHINMEKFNQDFEETEKISGSGDVLEDLIGDVKKDREYNRTLF